MKIHKTAFFLVLLVGLCAALCAPVLAYDNGLFEIAVDGNFTQVGDSYLWISSDRQASLSVAVNENTDELNVNQMTSYDLEPFAAGFLSGINGRLSAFLSEDAAAEIKLLKTELKDFDGGRAVTVDCYATCRADGQTSEVRLYLCTFSSQSYVYTVTFTAFDATFFEMGVSMAESFAFFDEPSFPMPPFWAFAAIIYYMFFIVYGIIIFAVNLLVVLAVVVEKQRRTNIRKAAVYAVFFHT